MRRYLLGVVMVLGLAAGYSQWAAAAPCAVGTIATYQTAGFTCDIGDKTFSNFSFTATAGADAGVLISPIAGPPFWGFDFFTPNLVSITTTAADIRIGYTVTCNGLASTTNCIVSAEMTIVGGETGTGGGTVGETICLNATTTVGCPAANTLALNTALIPPGPLSASVTFAGVHQLSILKDANVIGGANGNASISGITNTVDQGVPEPGTLALLGGALFSLAALRRRKISG